MDHDHSYKLLFSHHEMIADLLRGFVTAEWVHTVVMPEVQDLTEVHSMLAERVVEWTQQWKEEGFQQGLQQGLAAERALLLRLVRRRFGEACAQALAPLLEARSDPGVLEEIGEWIITYDTGEAFLTRVRGA